MCLVLIDTFSKFGWTIRLKNKTSHTITNPFENLFSSFKIKPYSIETSDGKTFVNETLTGHLKNKNFQKFFRTKTLGVPFAEWLNRTIRDILEKPVLFLKKGIELGRRFTQNNGTI